MSLFEEILSGNLMSAVEHGVTFPEKSPNSKKSTESMRDK